MTSRLRFAVFFTTMLAAAALPAAAQETRVYREGARWVEETTAPLPAVRQLRVNAEVGVVRVQGGRPEFTFTVRKRAQAATEAEARRQFDGYRVKAARQGETAVVSGECLTRAACQGGLSVEFTIQGPRELNVVNVRTYAGSVFVTDIAGRAEISTAGGNIEMGSIGGATRAHTKAGSITLKSAGGDSDLTTEGGNIHIGSITGKLNARTFGGSIKLQQASSDADLQTAGGSIWVKRAGGQLRAVTAGGTIEIGDVAGPVTLANAGGNIRLSSAGGWVNATNGGGGIQLFGLTHGVRVENAAGAIRATFIGGNFTESYLMTTAGDIVVHLPADLPVTVQAAIQMAAGHKITSDFSELRISSEESGFGPRQVYGEGGINGGGPVLRLRTISGNITVMRAPR